MFKSNNYYNSNNNKEIKLISPSIAFITITLSCIAILLTIVFYVFNIKYRNLR